MHWTFTRALGLIVGYNVKENCESLWGCWFRKEWVPMWTQMRNQAWKNGRGGMIQRQGRWWQWFKVFSWGKLLKATRWHEGKQIRVKLSGESLGSKEGEE